LDLEFGSEDKVANLMKNFHVRGLTRILAREELDEELYVLIS